MDFFVSGKFFFANMGYGLENGIHVVTEERKKLHNLVLELKGNIRVFVRVSWLKYLEGYTSDGGSVVGGRCFLRCFFFLPFLKKSIIPRFILKEYQRKSMNNVS